MRALIGVELLRRLPAGRLDIRDTKLSGFVLRVRPSGTHSYFVNYARGRWQLIGTTATHTAPDAREAARRVLATVMQGGDPVAEKREARASITLGGFVTAYYEPWATVQRKSGVEQTKRLRVTFASFLDRPLEAITPFEVERWRSGRIKAGIDPATTNRDLATLRGALSRAVEWKVLATHPHPRGSVKASRVDRRGVVRYLSSEEGARLRAALTARDDRRRAERSTANIWRASRGYPTWPAFGRYSDHLTPLVLTALNTGLRRGELFQLRWRECDLTGRHLTVRGDGAKSGQTRVVPLNSTIVEILATWRAQQAEAPDPTALVFPGLDGAPLQDIKSAWLKLVKAAPLTAFRFHDCRHDFASRLVQRGVDLNTVRELLGHADIKMVLRYAHLAPEHTAAAVERLAM